MIDDGGWFMKSKRTFSREYKLAAVKKIVEQGQSYAEVAKDLGVGDGLLRNWQKKFEAEGVLSPRPAGSVEDELKRLREENRRLKMEREILKKATAFFANPNG
jgi:transposase